MLGLKVRVDHNRATFSFRSSSTPVIYSEHGSYRGALHGAGTQGRFIADLPVRREPGSGAH
jgi:hypothetical protein